MALRESPLCLTAFHQHYSTASTNRVHSLTFLSPLGGARKSSPGMTQQLLQPSSIPRHSSNYNRLSWTTKRYHCYCFLHYPGRATAWQLLYLGHTPTHSKKACIPHNSALGKCMCLCVRKSLSVRLSVRVGCVNYDSPVLLTGVVSHVELWSYFLLTN